MTHLRPLIVADLQAVFHYFGQQAAAYFQEHRTLPPACVLVWLDSVLPFVKALHQFPAEQVSELLQSEEGKMSMASAIQAILNPELVVEEVPSGPRPDLVVQILLANTARPALADKGEAILMLVHSRDTTHAVALPVDVVSGAVELPDAFDIEAMGVVHAETDLAAVE